MKFFGKFFIWMISIGALFGVIGACVLFYMINQYSQNLPDYSNLANYAPSISTRIYAGDGQLIEEYAIEKRVFVAIHDIPEPVKEAFLAAEDKNFYSHPGVDAMGVARAIVTNLKNRGNNRRLVGASTITQQVAKNFLLTNEVSYERKIKEALVSFRMEKTFTKDQILELYLNEIYLGNGRYGVAAAALGYFSKSLGELDIHEIAYLAALPKAPNNYQVDRNPEEAKWRRDWVLKRMKDDKYITKEEMITAQAEPLELNPQKILDTIDARYFNEDVRREVSTRYGEDALYEGGLVVRTTLDPTYQKIASDALIKGLIDYDRRHGWRGPIKKFDSTEDWQTKLKAMEMPAGSKKWRLAIVLKLNDEKASIGLRNESTGTVPLSAMKWARKWKRKQYLGPTIKKPSDVLNIGDVVLVNPIKNEENTYSLEQIPNVQGGIVVIDPHTGRVLAMQGGFDYKMSEFNRGSQALRQPGSAFKPFVYLTAMDNGFTPSHLVLDAPVVIDQGPGLEKWRPTNYSNEFYGLTPIRVGLEKSRNLMTVRLADHIGMEKVVDMAKKFKIFDDMPNYLSMSLGSAETTLLRLSTAYAMLVNGGKDVTPTLIDRVQDRDGLTIYRHDNRPCTNCGDKLNWENQDPPSLPDNRDQITDPRIAYQVVSMMEGVVQRGTGVRLKSLNRPLGGKTGTTNDSKDAWFIGFTPDLIVGSYIGFDDPRSLGKKETGSSVAAPVVKDFFKKALKDEPIVPFRIPEGVRLVRVNAKTGQLAQPGDTTVIWEAFIPGTEPDENMIILDSEGVADPSVNFIATPPDEAPTTGTGGIY